jgi:DNA-binding MarR family transcriptional regulator
MTERWTRSQRLAAECVVELIRTDSLVEAAIGRCFRRHGLTGPSFNILAILAGAERPLSPHEIGDRLLVTRGTVTGLLDTLERQHLVRRRRHATDRRRFEIHLEQRGRDVLGRATRELFPYQVKLLAPLAAREQVLLVRLLRKLQAGHRPD